MPNLFMIDIVGKQLTAIEEEILRHPQVGGVILFTPNYSDKAQIKQLTNAIRQIRDDLIIAVDHEGGEVQRFHRGGVACAPAAQVYGEAYDLDPVAGIKLTKDWSKKIAADLHDCGVNLNFVPVLDLHDDGSTIIGQLGRAFHSEPELVTILAGAFIDEMKEAKMPSIGKHFPGHGRCLGANSDSHLSLPVNDASLEQLMSLDIKPFSDLIKAGKLDAVMAAHVLYPKVDPVNPAGYSKRWLKDILRDNLGFEGLVMSDCLSMKGADIGDMRVRAQRSLEAGCDMLILCQQERSFLLDFLKNNHFDQCPESIRRIQLFKEKMHEEESLVCSFTG